MNYICCDCVFGTLEEASAFANLIFHETGMIVEVRATKRKVTHIYNLEVDK